MAAVSMRRILNAVVVPPRPTLQIVPYRTTVSENGRSRASFGIGESRRVRRAGGPELPPISVTGIWQTSVIRMQLPSGGGGLVGMQAGILIRRESYIQIGGDVPASLEDVFVHDGRLF